MTIIKEDNRVGPAVCCECGDDAKINDSGKWYCGMESELGIFNIKGYCIKKRKKERKNKNDKEKKFKQSN